MSEARNSFVTRINTLAVCLSNSALTSIEPSEVDHNNSARILRNGLAVVAFSTLEDFLRSRLGEVLSRIGESGLPFDRLPAGLQEVTTIGAVKALAYQGDLRKTNGEDFMSFLQTECSLTASTATSAYRLSRYSMGWERPNLGDAEIRKILKAFKVKGGWDNFDSLSRRVGLGSLPTIEAYRQALKRRNLAAHAASADTELAHLKDFLPIAFGVAIAFDSLVSHCLRRILDHETQYLRDDTRVNESDIKFRFIDDHGRVWKERKEGTTRATKIASNKADLISHCMANAHSRDDVVVIRNARSQPIDWLIQNVT